MRENDVITDPESMKESGSQKFSLHENPILENRRKRWETPEAKDAGSVLAKKRRETTPHAATNQSDELRPEFP